MKRIFERNVRNVHSNRTASPCNYFMQYATVTVEVNLGPVIQLFSTVFSFSFVTIKLQKWDSSWDNGTYRTGDQRRLRRACASAQSNHSLRCSYTWTLEVDEGSYQNIRHLAPLNGCACIFEKWIYGGWKVPKSQVGSKLDMRYVFLLCGWLNVAHVS